MQGKVFSSKYKITCRWYWASETKNVWQFLTKILIRYKYYKWVSLLNENSNKKTRCWAFK